MKVAYKVLLLMVLICSINNLFGQEIEFSTDFPGGNIVIDKVSNDTVYLSPDIRDTEGHWFYWYFAVRGAAEKNFMFQFKNTQNLGAFGPAVSLDHGETWQWLYDSPAKRRGFAFSIPENASEVRFSMGM